MSNGLRRDARPTGGADSLRAGSISDELQHQLAAAIGKFLAPLVKSRMRGTICFRPAHVTQTFCDDAISILD